MENTSLNAMDFKIKFTLKVDSLFWNGSDVIKDSIPNNDHSIH